MHNNTNITLNWVWFLPTEKYVDAEWSSAIFKFCGWVAYLWAVPIQDHIQLSLLKHKQQLIR